VEELERTIQKTDAWTTW